MAPPLLTLTNIHLTFGGTPLLEGAAMSVLPGDRLCLVGRNGSGKSTLLKIAAGLIEPDEGERFLKPGTTIRYLEQSPDLSQFDTLEDYIRAGLTGVDMGERIPYLLDALSIDGAASPKTISGGEGRRAALARVLASQPDVLLLDEPTNHLDLPIIEWLENELGRYSGALVLISHDRAFASKLSKRTLWVDRGETREFGKSFQFFEDWRDEFLEQEDLDRHKHDRKIAREQHWIVHGVSGRRKRNVRRLKALKTLRQEKRYQKQSVGSANINTVGGQTSGKRVAELKSVSKAFDGRTVIDDFSARIMRGERVGLVGPNGSGKTTLLKLMMGEIHPDDGHVDLGVNLEPLVIDQNRAGLDPETRLKDALVDGDGDMVIIGNTQKHVIGYMKDFLFAPEQQRTPIGVLSGGERARVELARGLRKPSNFLILDEPTNDLDLETLDLLQELIAEYEGTVVLVSHDRDFLDRTVTTTIAYEGKGQWQIYAGGYTDMTRQRGHGVDAKKKMQSERIQKPSNTSEAILLKGKLSYKHKFRLESLPKLIADQEAQLEMLNQAMSDPELYAKDPDKFNTIVAAIGEAQSELESLEEEYLDLEILREDTQG